MYAEGDRTSHAAGTDRTLSRRAASYKNLRAASCGVRWMPTSFILYLGGGPYAKDYKRRCVNFYKIAVEPLPRTERPLLHLVEPFQRFYLLQRCNVCAVLFWDLSKISHTPHSKRIEQPGRLSISYCSRLAGFVFAGPCYVTCYASEAVMV